MSTKAFAPSNNLKYHSSIANIVIQRLYDAYMNKTHLFSRVHADFKSAPQVAFRPEGVEVGSMEFLRFLFFATVLTYRSDSNLWFSQAKTMHKKYPDLFTEKVLSVDEYEIENALQDVGFVYHGQAAGYWARSGRTLFTHFDGNPLNMYRFADVDHFISYKKLLKKRNGDKEMLSGIGPKIYSLLGVFYQEIGALKELPEGTFPADLHVMRIMIGTGSITGRGEVDAARNVAELSRKKIAGRARRSGLSVEHLAHAYWLLGSEACYRCNDIKGIDKICPTADICKGSPDVELYGNRGKWDFDAPGRRKGHPQGAVLPKENALDLLLGKKERKMPSEIIATDYGPAPDQITFIEEEILAQ